MFLLKKEAGFTLIELTIVMVIIGLMFAGVARFGTSYFKAKQLDESKDNIRAVQKSIRDFIAADADGAGAGVLTNGRYPCPASLTADPTTAAYGAEQRDNNFLSATFGDCLVVAGVTQVPTTNVFIGAIPFKTLGLSQASALDPWQNRMTYAVTSTLAADGQPLLAANPIGAITIEQNDVADPAAAINNFTTTAHFVIDSHGEDQAGSFTTEGVANAMGCRAAEGDTENCDGDAVFSDLIRVEQGNAFYDDRMAFLLTDNDDGSTWWGVSPADPDAIYNLNAGPVGIGRIPVNPTSALEVQGGNISFHSPTSTSAINFNWPNIPGNARMRMWDANGNIGVYIASDHNSYFNGGNVGIGTDMPVIKLDINGGLRIGQVADGICTMLTIGALRYDDITDCLEFCANNEGAPKWQPACIDTTPDDFTFISQTDVELQ